MIGINRTPSFPKRFSGTSTSYYGESILRLSIGVLISLIGVSATYGQAIPSLVIPPSNEPQIVFSNNGKTYLIGQRTGKVTTLDATPAPDYPVPPVLPTNLSGLAKTVFERFAADVPRANQKEAATGFLNAVNATLAQIGGLGLKGQDQINSFSEMCKTFKVADLASGFKLGDLLQANGIDTDAKFVQALEDIKKAMLEVK